MSKISISTSKRIIPYSDGISNTCKSHFPSWKSNEMTKKVKIGPDYSGRNHCEFVVWAPHRKTVSLLLGKNKKEIEMDRLANGYWKCSAEGIKLGSEYMYRLDNQTDRPDPASHFQPNGVFGASEVIDHESFAWKDAEWRGFDLKDIVFYEVHTGTFTEEGTLAAAQERIAELARFGINAIELMPIAQFSGDRNWGYDGVFPYAVQNTYGGSGALKSFINHCHQHEVAVFLDVVFNHLGPEGNCLRDFGPYFLENRKTLWGSQVNLDGALSFGVRNYFLENALYWFRDYHVDGLRLDAVHAIVDTSPKHFLQELAETVRIYAKKTSRRLYLIAESDGNDPRIIKPKNAGGYGLDAQWLDDFHHSLHALLTGERQGYYTDFGRLQHLAKSFNEGYAYSGQYSRYRKTKHGKSSKEIPPCKFVVFSQNHDQIGNRMMGERLISLAGFEAAKLAAGIVVLSPYEPLLFMGEEYGERNPFLYFTNYADRNLAEAVKRGRKQEFAKFEWRGEPPNPQSVSTFKKSKIDWHQRNGGLGKKALAYYERLFYLRKTLPHVRHAYIKRAKRLTSDEDECLLFVDGDGDNSSVIIVANFHRRDSVYDFPGRSGTYAKVLDSADPVWGGPGSELSGEASVGDEHMIRPLCLAVFVQTEESKVE